MNESGSLYITETWIRLLLYSKSFVMMLPSLGCRREAIIIGTPGMCLAHIFANALVTETVNIALRTFYTCAK